MAHRSPDYRSARPPRHAAPTGHRRPRPPRPPRGQGWRRIEQAAAVLFAGWLRWPARLARRPSRLTAAAAAAALAGLGTIIALTAGAAAPAGAVSDLDGARAASQSRPGDGARTALSPPPAAPASPPRPAAPRRPPRTARPAAPAEPYLIYDSVRPAAIPDGKIVATYATGPGAAPASAVAGRGHVVWIDITGRDYAASVLDVEPGNASPAMAASWAAARLGSDRHVLARIYTMISEWPAVQQAVAGLPAQERSRIRWWIADPTGHPHIVPGSQATQWYWGSHYDISTALPAF